MFEHSFKDVVKSPSFFATHSGGAFEPTREAVEIISAEALVRAQLSNVTDIAGLKAIEQEVWREFYELVGKDFGN